LNWVKERLDKGQIISELIVDGKIIRDRSREVTGSQRPKIDFSSIPQPVTEEGQQMRRQLEHALIDGDAGKRALIESQAMLLRPSERKAIISALLLLP
jgi:hypothetical protein